MRRIHSIFYLLCCCLLLAITFMSTGAPLHASDLGQPRGAYPEDRPHHGKLRKQREVAAFCYEQRRICRKICNLRSNFDDRFDGCPQSCESRELRCNATACYKWTEPDFLIAERFGGFKCAL
jgi:hypothetical protein